MDVDDLELLRAYEPVARFTDGEYFYPVSVERYLARAGLWRYEPGERAVEEVPAGQLDIDSLAQVVGREQGLRRSLSGVGSDSVRLGAAHIPVRERPHHLKGASRLASVGLAGRLVDTANRFSLLFRGSVPGGSAARSFLLQRDHLEPDKPTYYARVVRDDPWIVCQYWFFYSFNNWRSAFGGVNEHEADWEQVTVYLDGTGVVDADGLPPARWVVFSAHDEVGDDLRRRWDDPDLARAGRHPVVYVGAGSHSGAYLPGDYLITVKPPAWGGLVRALRWSARLLTPWSAKGQVGIGIPYVDYARGDGRAIGPGQEDDWTPVVIDDDTGWVRGYRGLWGRDTRDRLGGERGPAGPRYNRSGSVRQSWADPVGWAGLAKVAPNPAAERALIKIRARQTDERLQALDQEIDALRQELLVTAAGSAAASPEVRGLAPRERKLIDLRLERTRLADERALDAADAPAVPAHPHAHLSHRRTPMEPLAGLRGRFASWWAVLSTPLILATVGEVVSPFSVAPTVTLLLLLLLLLATEGLARGKFGAVILRILLALAVITLLVVLWYEGRYVLGVVLLGAALLVLVVNMREALRR